MKAIKRIGVLTSGGDAPGMNAAVRAVARTALAKGIECVGIRRGWQGLINGDFTLLNRESVGHILSRGGTILYTARSSEFMTEEGQKKAVATCKMLGIDGIVAIGGDGTFRGALALSRLGVPVVGVPATIDNDIGCTHYTIGFDTACNTAIECIDRLRDTMQSHERCSIVEVMGRNAGFLALYVGISVGATAVLIPERKLNFQRDVVERIQDSRLAGNTHFMIVVAEGVGSAVDIGWVAIPLLFFATLGTVNGANFTDGLDGLASSVTAVIAAFFAVVALEEGSGVAPVSLALIGALLAFLLFNVCPARVFMGDTGSLALGGYVVASAYMLKMPVFILIVACIYLVEVLSVIIQVSYFKISGGKRVFKMAPIHHHFELCGWSETRIVAVFTIITILLSVIAYMGR